ncbi:uncharacterized protein LOC108028464 [Drosophila biarmipes]|uniref:uncharacterized protein LOC108028464 n=1 Tax=Drosophila biarmipes TaxID=125945 RepID=UPI0007E6CC73|nr:uncharacterized protein LOC108028464 [Drosophila biarmipes]
MSELKRRPLHDDSPRTLSQPRAEVDQNNQFTLECVNSYEEGTSSAGEQEESESQEQVEDSEDGNVSRRNSIPTPKPSLTQEHHHSIHEPQGTNGLYIKLALAGALFGLLFVYVWGGSSVKGDKQCAFKDLRQNNPQQPEIVWRALQTGVEGLINKRDKHPSVFLFLHQDPKLQKLIDAIAVEASACYGGPRQLIHMKKEDFGPDMKDHGLAIERFKAKVKDGKVFLIVNLNDIAPSGALALHTICDTYSPVVEDAVIFLTLRTFNTTAVKNSVQLATDTLYDLWAKELQDNELDPLITRVTDQVLHLRSVSYA